MMRWPWQRRGGDDLLVLSWADQTLAYVRARALGVGRFEVLRFGVERQGGDSQADFVRRLDALGLKGCDARAMLRQRQYQWLQIEAPGVAPEELRSAARYQIRDMLDVHIDDVTIDVMRVGADQSKGTPHLFVIAAPNAVLRSVMELGALMRWQIPVIDVQETAQRNLQNALVDATVRADRANAALVLVDDAQAILTICANEELYYTRRVEIPQGFLAGTWGAAPVAEQSLVDAYAPVEEYVPDYDVGGVAHGSDYSPPPGSGGGARDASASGEGDTAQRFLVEVQRSLDLWDRAWSSMPLELARVFAGPRTGELAQWLSVELGQPMVAMDVDAYFTGFAGGSDDDRTMCWPLLGLLLRTDSRQL